MMKLNFILPFFPLKPGGGCKIMYEYANRFGEKGYDVQIYHVTTLPYMKYKYPHWLRYLRNNILYTSFPQLFYPLMTRQFFCDFHEKSEDFCVS